MSGSLKGTRASFLGLASITRERGLVGRCALPGIIFLLEAFLPGVFFYNAAALADLVVVAPVAGENGDS